jgi:hypothetical protein
MELDEALERQMPHIAQIEGELADLRQKYARLQGVLAEERERIGRVVRHLKIIRRKWIESRRLLTEASADRT